MAWCSSEDEVEPSTARASPPWPRLPHTSTSDPAAASSTPAQTRACGGATKPSAASPAAAAASAPASARPLASCSIAVVMRASCSDGTAGVGSGTTTTFAAAPGKSCAAAAIARAAPSEPS